jgi:hypothetical protein
LKAIHLEIEPKGWRDDVIEATVTNMNSEYKEKYK